jgi:chromosome segregation ATPase
MNSIGVTAESSVLITDSQNNPMSIITTKEYKELKDKEIRKNILEQKYAEMLLNVEKYVEEIRILKEEKELLEKTIFQLKIQIQELTDKNLDLQKRLCYLEEESENNNKLLKISQCIYNYKEQLKNKITQQEQELSRYDLFDILLNEDFDDQLSNEQLIVKKEINNKLNHLYGGKRKINGTRNLKRLLSQITYERNIQSHPVIIETEKTQIKKDFLEYCNKRWHNDSINEILANDIFQFSIDSS